MPARARTQLRAIAADIRAHMPLSFQKLHVYREALAFIALVYAQTETFSRGNAERVDQLVRSAESIVRNIAEGAGRWSRADAARSYAIARGEAMECAASFDLLLLRKLVSDDVYATATEHLRAIVAMLTRMMG